MENVLVADFMLEKRGVDSGSMITGKSTHNQRIERLWRDVFTGVLSYFYKLFYSMEEEGILDPLNETHLACLRYVYLPKLNERLKNLEGAWAHRRMRTTKTTPWKLWLSGQMSSPIGMDISVEELSGYGIEGDIPDEDDHENADSDSRPITEPVVLSPYYCRNYK